MRELSSRVITRNSNNRRVAFVCRLLRNKFQSYCANFRNYCTQLLYRAIQRIENLCRFARLIVRTLL
jgi:hypothetical protein